MKKYSLHSIMRAAWKFFRKGVSSFSLALRMAWANAKTQNAAKATAEITEETHTWYGWKELGYEVVHDSITSIARNMDSLVKMLMELDRQGRHNEAAQA